jgi:quercetin dioxygenase-like cupin family protein
MGIGTNGTGRRTAQPTFRGPGEGLVLSNPVGGHVTFKVRGEQTDGRLTAFETVVAPGDGPPLHVHTNEDETFYVLEGDVRFKLADELRQGGRGTFLFIPRGTPHTFQNVGREDARVLIHFSPAGMERFFQDFADLAAADPSSFATIGAEAGMIVVGPPLPRC